MTPPKRPRIDKTVLRDVADLLLRNPTLVRVNDQARAGYWAAVTTLTMLSEGMPPENVLTGVPELGSAVKERTVEEAFSAITEGFADAPLKPVLDKANLRLLADGLRETAADFVFGDESEDGVRRAFAAEGAREVIDAIDAIADVMPDLASPPASVSVPRLLSRLNEATSISEVRDILAPFLSEHGIPPHDPETDG